MNRFTKLIAMGLCLLCVHFAYAQNSSAPSCPPKECPKPCPPKPCPQPQPCPPKPCKPCPPVCFERGYPDEQCCLPSAYNEPADYQLGPCPWDFWFDASFTYWLAYQEGMELAESSATVTDVAAGTPFEISVLSQGTSWEPGFKVGLGMDLGHDNWSGYAEYTWFRSRTSTSSAAPLGPTGSTNPVWEITNWNLGSTTDSGLYRAATASSVWRLRMDLLDAALTRPYYQGKNLIIAPFGGLRASWIRQNLRMSVTPNAVAESTNPSAVFHHKSSSWAIGPRAGFQGEWHLGWGFRFEGDVAGSINFTQYTTLAAASDAGTTTQLPQKISLSNYNTMRFNNDMNVGLGWGSYFDCRNYHFDLLLTYDFQIFWDQNMMRYLADFADDGIGAQPSNLYLQGLTVRAQFDF